MKRNPEEMLKAGMELPPEARAALAGMLIDSLDQDIDEGAEAAWEDEIARRLQEIDGGKLQLVPWTEVRRLTRH